MTYLSLQASKRLLLKKLKDEEIGVIDSVTKSFQWGFVFHIQSIEFIKTGENPLIQLIF